MLNANATTFPRCPSPMPCADASRTVARTEDTGQHRNAERRNSRSKRSTDVGAPPRPSRGMPSSPFENTHWPTQRRSRLVDPSPNLVELAQVWFEPGQGWAKSAHL